MRKALYGGEVVQPAEGVLASLETAMVRYLHPKADATRPTSLALLVTDGGTDLVPDVWLLVARAVQVRRLWYRVGATGPKRQYHSTVALLQKF